MFDTATLYVVIEGKTTVRNDWQNLNDRVFLTVCFYGFKNDQHLKDAHIERIEWWFPIEKKSIHLKNTHFKGMLPQWEEEGTFIKEKNEEFNIFSCI